VILKISGTRKRRLNTISKKTAETKIKSSRSSVTTLPSQKSAKKTRSSSRSKSKGHKKLSLDDLNLTHDESRSDYRLSNRKVPGRRRSIIQDTNTSINSDSRNNTPRKSSQGLSSISQNSASKSSKLGRSSDKRDKEIYKSDSNKSLKKPLDSTDGYHSRSQSGSKNNASYKADFTKKSPTKSSEKDYATSELSIASYNNNVKVPNPFEIERMNEVELSSEIVKIERVVSELKREYKNLLAKSQGDALDSMPEIRSRMNIVASELQSKSEVHLLLKKKQKELLQKSTFV